MTILPYLLKSESTRSSLGYFRYLIASACLSYGTLSSPLPGAESTKIAATSDDEMTEIYSVPVYDPVNNSQQLIYVATFKSQPVGSLIPDPNSAAHVAWAKENVFIYSFSYQLALLAVSPTSIQMEMIDISALTSKGESVIPYAGEGPIVHEWIEKLDHIEDGIVAGIYIRAKYPKKYAIPFEIYLKAGESPAISVGNAKRIEWGGKNGS